MHPVLFQIGKFPIRAYGTLIVAGFMLGLWRTMRRCAALLTTAPDGSPRRIEPDHVFDLAIPGLMAGLLGARLLFVALNWGSYAGSPAEILKIWSGGLSLHGGLLAGILYLLAYCKIKKVPLLPMADVCAAGWSLAYVVGRFGCLFNGCCYGGTCDLPWGIRFPDERFPGSNPPIYTPPSHPTQIYGSLFNLVFFVILAQWEKRKRTDGEIFYAYIGMYGFYRFVVEYFRVGGTADYIRPNIPLTLTHVISLAMMAVAVAGIGWLRRNRTAYKDTELPNAAATNGEAVSA
jgi:phosphatidylglycerol---prolipoprotein diacylglyceryl transferase